MKLKSHATSKVFFDAIADFVDLPIVGCRFVYWWNTQINEKKTK